MPEEAVDEEKHLPKLKNIFSRKCLQTDNLIWLSTRVIRRSAEISVKWFVSSKRSVLNLKLDFEVIDSNDLIERPAYPELAFKRTHMCVFGHHDVQK